MRKLVNLESLSLREYDDGVYEVTLLKIDQVTRRVVPIQVMLGMHDPAVPFTSGEILLRAAAERVGDTLYEPDVPF